MFLNVSHHGTPQEQGRGGEGGGRGSVAANPECDEWRPSAAYNTPPHNCSVFCSTVGEAAKPRGHSYNGNQFATVDKNAFA